MNEAAEITNKIESIIGPNVAYVRADEKERPLALEIAATFAAHLLVVFVIAFAKRLGKDVEKEAENKGEEAADFVWSRFRAYWGSGNPAATGLSEEQVMEASKAAQKALEQYLKTEMPKAPKIAVETMVVNITNEIHQYIFIQSGQRSGN
jgi:hypothetical protein